jgi:hypothetical protein
MRKSKFLLLPYKSIMLMVLIIGIIWSGLSWLEKKPRHFALLNSIVSKELNDYNYQLTQGEFYAQWLPAEKALEVTALQMQISAKEGSSQIFIPRVSLKANVKSLLQGHFTFSELYISEPDVKLYLGKQLQQQQDVKMSFKDLAKNLSLSQYTFLSNLQVKGGKITINKANGKSLVWNINQAESSMSTQNDNLVLNSKLNLKSEGKEISLNFKAEALEAAPEKEVRTELELLNFPFYLLPSSLTDSMNFKNQSQQSLIVNSLKASGVIQNSAEQIKITSADANLSNGAQIRFSGNMHSFLEMEINILIEKLPIDDINIVWLKQLGSEAREWVLGAISSGVVTKAIGNFKIKPEYISSGLFPDGTIAASIEFSGAKLDYYSSMPAISQLNGKVTFDNKEVQVKLTAGQSKDSLLLPSSVKIPYSSGMQSFIMINGKVIGPAADLIHYIPAESVAEAQKNSIHLHNLRGEAETDFNIQIPMVEKFDFSDMKLNLKSHLNNLSLGNLPNGINLSQGKLLAEFDGKVTKIEGQALLNNNASTLKLSSFVSPQAKYDTVLSLQTTLLPYNMTGFTINNKPIFTRGKIILEADYTSKKGEQKIEAKANLHDAELQIDKIGFKKKTGENAQAQVLAMLTGGETITVNHFGVQGNKFNIAGKADIYKTSRTAKTIVFDRLRYNNTDLTASFHHFQHGYNLNISGNVLDLREADLNDLFEQDEHSAEQATISVKIKQILLKNNEKFYNFTSDFSCNQFACMQGKISTGLNNNNYMELKLVPKDSSNSELKIQCGNASNLFQAFDLYNKMKQGSLIVNGTKTIGQDGKIKLSGDINIYNFTVANNSVLAKLITMLSLPGLFTIGGNDIPFTELKVNFVQEGPKFTFSNGTIKGSQLGMTLEGTINNQAKRVDVTGTIIPDLFNLNTLPIPLLGQLLQGGKDKGLIAANYSIKGPFDNVSTQVNPLSIFLPGPFRMLLNLFK